MNLTAYEVEEGARRLARSALGRDWDRLQEHEKEGFRQIVWSLAQAVKTERTPEAVHVFLTWMGDDDDAEYILETEEDDESGGEEP